MGRHYRVRWEIDVEAASALDAAWLARELQKDPRSVATVFEVVDQAGLSATFDLLAPACAWAGVNEDSPKVAPRRADRHAEP